LRAGELSELVGFLVSSLYNLTITALKGFSPALEFPLTPSMPNLVSMVGLLSLSIGCGDGVQGFRTELQSSQY